VAGNNRNRRNTQISSRVGTRTHGKIRDNRAPGLGPSRGVSGVESQSLKASLQYSYQKKGKKGGGKMKEGSPGETGLIRQTKKLTDNRASPVRWIRGRITAAQEENV